MDCLHVLLSTLTISLSLVPANHRQLSLPFSAWKSLKRLLCTKQLLADQLCDWRWAHYGRRGESYSTKSFGEAALKFNALQCTALHLSTLNYTLLDCTALHWSTLNCTLLHCTALKYTKLFFTLLHCTKAHCTVTPDVSFGLNPRRRCHWTVH